VLIKVVDQTNAVIPHANVRVFPLPHPRPESMQTDIKGELALELDSGGHALFISASGFDGDVRHIEVDPNKADQQFPVVLRIGSYSGPVVVVSDELAAEYAGKLHLSAMPFHEEWSLTRQDFRNMARTTVNVVNPETGKRESYSGVRLSDLLEQAGVPMGDAWDEISLSRYLQVSGNSPRVGQTWVLFSLAELQPGLHAGEILIANSFNGQPIGYVRGPFVLVVSADEHRVRWLERVRQLKLQVSGR
jgi:hypothetical protein